MGHHIPQPYYISYTTALLHISRLKYSSCESCWNLVLLPNVLNIATWFNNNNNCL